MVILAAAAAALVVARWSIFSNRYERLPWIIGDELIIVLQVITVVAVLAGLGALTFIAAVLAIAAGDVALVLVTLLDAAIVRARMVPPEPPRRR